MHPGESAFSPMIHLVGKQADHLAEIKEKEVIISTREYVKKEI